MKNDAHGKLYAQGTEAGKSYTKYLDKKKRTMRKLILGIGLPLISIIGYQYLPTKFSREVTAEDRVTIENCANEKKLETLYSNAKLYRKNKNLNSLETAFLSERPEDIWTNDEKQIISMVNNGADVLAYHLVGRISKEKVVDYNKNNIRAYSKTVRSVTRNPSEFLEDLNQSMKKGNGTLIALIGSGREHYNILSNRSIDPNCSVGILEEFRKKHPEYSNKIKAIFFHPNSQDPLFGQPEYENEKYNHISENGWKNAILGINLGKDDLAKPIITEEGWKDGKFWAEGPGITNFSDEQISMDKKITDSKLKEISKESNKSNFYWLPWSTIPKDKNAIKAISKNYSLVFVGHNGRKVKSKSKRIISAKIMGSK